MTTIKQLSDGFIDSMKALGCREASIKGQDRSSPIGVEFYFEVVDPNGVCRGVSHFISTAELQSGRNTCALTFAKIQRSFEDTIKGQGHAD